MKTLSSIIGNSQKLDGGAMFGHVPKALWSKWLTPDEKNRVTLATRALLIQENDKNILLVGDNKEMIKLIINKTNETLQKKIIFNENNNPKHFSKIVTEEELDFLFSDV